MAKTRILVVEDEGVVAQDLKRTLEDLDYTISSVVCFGEEAVKNAEEEKPDLVLMDIVLQGEMNGIEAAKRIREQLDIPVVYLTAYTDEETLARAKITEPFGYVVKPFEQRELHSAIQIALYKSNAEKKIRHLNAVLRAIRNVNQLLVREIDRRRLFKGICQSLIETGAYHFAWIALTDSSGLVTASAEAGLGDNFLPMIHYLKRGKLTQCIRKALEQTEIVIIENPDTACPDCPLSGTHPDKAAVAFRIENREKVYGVIIASCSWGFISDSEEQGLFKEVVGDVGLALRNLETEQDKKAVEEALRKSETLYRILAENVTDVIWTTDMNLQLTYISPSVTPMRGYSVEETLAQTPEEIFLPASLELAMKVLTEEMAAEESGEADPSRSRTLELEQYRKDGSTLWTEVKSSFLRDTDGRAVGILGITRDIAERRQAQEELTRIAAELKEFINTANAPIFGIDNEGRINEWNQAAERITGFAKDEVMGKGLVEDFITKDYKASVAEVLVNAMKGEESANFEFPLYSKGGRRLMILLNATTRRDYSGNIIGAIGVGQDVTELTEYREGLEEKVAERTAELNRALYDTEEARDRIDGILKSVADGLIVTDIYNRVILMNRATEELLGIRLSEVIDRSIDFAIQDETLRERIKATLEKKEKGEQFDFELPAEEGDHPRIIRARTSMILDKLGKERGIITIMHDVTYEREVDRMKTEFISTAAHELRTPLTSIQGFSEILLRRDDIKEEEKKKFLSYINKQAITLGKIVSDLLDISRIESGYGFTLDKARHNPGEFIEGIIEYFQNISASHHFEVALPDNPMELLIDKDKMEQALINIIENAVKYSPEGGIIRVAGEGFEDHYQVSVEDQGIGMTPEQVEKIFDKFYRVDTSHSAPVGTGLGMTIVKNIVEAHGGLVWVESECGKGTKVVFTIPGS